MFSEAEFQGKLADTRRPGAGDPSEKRGTQTGIGIPEVWMVKGVEKFGTKLEFESFGEEDRLH